MDSVGADADDDGVGCSKESSAARRAVQTSLPEASTEQDIEREDEGIEAEQYEDGVEEADDEQNNDDEREAAGAEGDAEFIAMVDDEFGIFSNSATRMRFLCAICIWTCSK